jgi:acylphosphatase
MLRVTSWVVVASDPAPAKPKVTGQNIIAVSGVVSGNVQQVGFRAMIQKQAIENNLAGSAKNNDDKTVQFSLQGDKNRVNQALAVPAKSASIFRSFSRNWDSVDIRRPRHGACRAKPYIQCRRRQ